MRFHLIQKIIQHHHYSYLFKISLIQLFQQIKSRKESLKTPRILTSEVGEAMVYNCMVVSWQHAHTIGRKDLSKTFLLDLSDGSQQMELDYRLRFLENLTLTWFGWRREADDSTGGEADVSLVLQGGKFFGGGRLQLWTFSSGIDSSYKLYDLLAFVCHLIIL